MIHLWLIAKNGFAIFFYTNDVDIHSSKSQNGENSLDINIYNGNKDPNL